MDTYSTTADAVLNSTRRAAIGALVFSAFITSSAMAIEATVESRFSPATFKSGEDSLEARFFLPRTSKGEELTIFCSALISVRGIIEEQRCNWDHSNKPYRIPAGNAIRNARLNPATVDGKKVIAYIKYAYKIQDKDGESTVKVYPHHFVNSQYYGDDYIAPQSYVAGTELDAMDSAFFGKPWMERVVPRKCLKSARVFLKMKIEKDGKVDGVEVLDKPRPKSCGKSIADAVAEANYIPAFFNGQAAASIYVEKYLAEKKARTGRIAK